jgi:transposase
VRKLDPSLFVALDLGVDVLAAATSNKPGFIPRLVNGRPVKAINQLYNKQREHEQKNLAKGQEKLFTSHRLDRITTKRNRRVMHSLHTASRRIIDLLVKEGIGTLVIGKNPFWKSRVELGKKHNPRFSGSRDKRWYRVTGRPPIHSDVNGSYNIGRKVFPTAFDGRGIEARQFGPDGLPSKL